MAKFSFKKIFNTVANWIEKAVAAPDLPSLSDSFALSAFKREGYEVLSRESFQFVSSDIPQVLEATEASYILSKDNKQYVGAVEGCVIATMGRFGDGGYMPRIHTIKSITPKS